MDEASPAWQARMLLRGARLGTLATAVDGQPFASLVTPATAPALSVLMLLSELSEHTRQLRAEPRCSLLVCGPAETANPQTMPRLTLTGLAAPVDDPGLKARWLAVHPYAAFYAGFADFGLWRMQPMAALLVGGFARATRLHARALAPDAVAVAALLAAEPGILAHCNTDHADALAAIAAGPGSGERWRMVAVDVDGCDLAAEDADRAVRRIAWSAPVADAGGVRQELIRLARQAREARP